MPLSGLFGQQALPFPRQSLDPATKTISAARNREHHPTTVASRSAPISSREMISA